MSRFVGVLTVVVVVVVAMAFASVNADHRTTLSLGLFTLYRVPVTFVAFSGLFLGMLVMFATGVVSDLKVRRILRERLTQESREEQAWIDRSQRDLFHDAEDESASQGGATLGGDVRPAAPPPAEQSERQE